MIRRAALGLVAVFAGWAPPAAATTPPTTPASTPASTPWVRIELPGGLSPASLTAAGGELWVGGRQTADARPAIAHGGAARWTAVTVQPSTVYGEEADLVHVVEAPDGPHAIGIATGGQHLLPRWTLWAQDPVTHHLVEQPQSFETFGGPSAGGLTDLIATPDGVRILGIWAPNSSWYGTALWSLRAPDWQRDAEPALASTDDLQQLPARVGLLGGRLVIVGTIARFDVGGNPMSQQVVWVQDGAGAWRAVQPRPTGPSSNGVLTDIGCLADTCLAVGGETRTGPSGWHLTLDRVDAAGRVTALTMPEIPFVIGADQPRLAVSETAVAVLSGTDPVLHLLRDRRWTVTARPPGRVLDAEIVDADLYLVIEDSGRRALWRAALGTI